MPLVSRYFSLKARDVCHGRGERTRYHAVSQASVHYITARPVRLIQPEAGVFAQNDPFSGFYVLQSS